MAGALLVAVAVAGCGAGSRRPTSTTTPSGSTTVTRSTTARSTTSRAPVRHAPTGPRIGARQAVHTHGAELTVTVLRVLALSHTGSPSLPGTRQVGVALRIANQAGQTYDSTASGDVSVLLSAGQAQPLDVRAGPCTTPLVDFESTIESGDVRTGCVGFSVPRRARVLGVRFSPHGRTAGTLTWRAG